MIRVWFNHWFSTAYHLINLIKEDKRHQYYIIGSNQNDFSAYCSACDEWYKEPDTISDQAYVEYCLEFCVKHNINIFIPRRGLTEIVKNFSKFTDNGILLLADNNYDVLNILDDKFQTYLYLKDTIHHNIPECRMVKGVAAFLEAVENLHFKGYRVCYKLVRDEGARSFRVIDDSIETLNGLYIKPGSKITLLAAIKVLRNYNFSIPIIVMPYLSGVEISVDCLQTENGNIILPRYKTNKRYSELKYDNDIIKLCDSIIKKLQLSMPVNIQFKIENDKPYLLEVNPRMSGGLQLSCKAANLNMPMIAVNKLLGENIEWSYKGIDGQKVVHIETPVCLNGHELLH